MQPPPAHTIKDNNGFEAPAFERVRLRRSDEEKYLIVEETFVRGASVAKVARKHGVNANQVFAWRKDYWEGKKPPKKAQPALPAHGFIKLGVVEDRASPDTGSPAARAAASCWRFEVELGNGIRVRLGDGVDEHDMRRVLAVARELA